jgi:hypothetical protein
MDRRVIGERSDAVLRTAMPGDDTVCVDAVLKLSVESIEVSATIPNERTPQFVFLFFRPSDPVFTPCLAQSRASARGAWLAEQGVAPGRCAYASSARVVSDHRPCPSQDGSCLQWLDVDGLKGGANAAWIEARSGSSVRLPEERSRAERRHQWSAGRRACLARHAAPSQRCHQDVAPFGAPLPHACEGKGKRGRTPRRPNNRGDESRLFECAV